MMIFVILGWMALLLGVRSHSLGLCAWSLIFFCVSFLFYWEGDDGD